MDKVLVDSSSTAGTISSDPGISQCNQYISHKGWCDLRIKESFGREVQRLPIALYASGEGPPFSDGGAGVAVVVFFLQKQGVQFSPQDESDICISLHHLHSPCSLAQSIPPALYLAY
mmetsp:Transcript_4248/g.9511  ORF Transcript_4248/g.9511 Transcript_4248/m.9511 type:complete len:117 (+) Transcript_4248:592-942(+)